MATQKPVNQKSVYHSFADLYVKSMDDLDIPIERIEVGVKALSGMNTAYALELKRAEIEHMLEQAALKTQIRTIEVKAFDNIPIENPISEQRPE